MDLPIDSIICHDIAKGIPLPDGSIDMVITSPPYWGLRDYGEQVKSIWGGEPNCEHVFDEYNAKLTHENRQNLDGGTIGNDKFREKLHGYGKAKAGFCQICGAWYGQLGLEPHPQMFIDHLVMICKEIKRVLKKTGSFYLNLGDTYGGSGRGYGSPPDPKWIKARCDKNKSKPSWNYDGKWIQPKQLLGIPWRVAIALQNDGWILRNDIIWHKPNPMPSSVKDRLNTTFEHIFHFVKNKKYFYDLDAIREPHKIESLERAEYGFNVIPRAWKQETIPVSGGKNVNIDCHPSGKNPGDTFQTKKEPYIINNPHRMRLEKEKYIALNPNKPNDLSYPVGKNPGDVIRTDRDQPEHVAPTKKSLPSQLRLDPKKSGWGTHEMGKNPGDILEYDSKYKDGNYGQTLQGFIRVQSIAKNRVEFKKMVQKLFPNDPKKQQELINHFHDHDSHPLGPNPGDVMKSWGADKNFEYHRDGKHNPMGQSPSDLKRNIIESFKDNPKGKNPGDVIRSGMHHGSSLSNKATHYQQQIFPMCDPKGKNPGDILQFDDEYWWNFILGRSHSNRFYQKAFGLMKNWMINNNCFDYNIFYQWYLEQVKGTWDTDNLEKGKANYLLDGKILPFPKPETRFLGDMPGDFWNICTQPFPEAHFAVYPEALCIKPIKSSCPQWICKKCGKPRMRITEKPAYGKSHTKTKATEETAPNVKHLAERRQYYRSLGYETPPAPDTIGWSDCGCNAGFLTGIVLDPFCGAGTSCVVAHKLERHYIGIDINPDYCKMAEKRLKQML